MTPLILPLGDRALLVRFGDTLSDAGNRAAVAFAARAAAEGITGVLEVAPNLVSVLMRYDPKTIDFDRLAGEVRLILSAPALSGTQGSMHRLQVAFDGEDLEEVATALGLSVQRFIELHNGSPLRVLATGFAPGFVYCGFHADELKLPRRQQVRRQVPAGTVLFAAGQTAITATPIPTGWHVIGHTSFRNFDADAAPHATLIAGDKVHFEALA